ncbi:MAG TPA: Gfo/Idh/MocA family oxidoreductase [Acidimicrobiales bacterium]|nr:Gfo/Idh/MocA family oxidoreductase [Acidimicrobiales bacterium]
MADTAAPPGPGIPGVAVIGCGPWGVNLVRNFHELGSLRAIHDVHGATAAEVSHKYGVPALSSEAVLADACVDAVVVAAPARHHLSIARRALAAGKHVMVEKPLALDVAGARELCRTADERGLVLMVGHLLQYHPAFLALMEMVDDGTLGQVRYLYSNRLNLGRIRREEDILWSFAPHDVSMILALVGAEPETVTATGGAYLSDGIADVTTTHLAFPGGERAHVFVSWLHPYKEQKLVVVGERAMAVFDDGEPWESKLCLFRHAIAWNGGVPEPVRAEPEAVPVERNEPLEAECRHFLSCVASGARPRTDGWEGLRVLRVLDRAARSMAADRRPASPSGPGSDDAVVHESAYVDEQVDIGAGTRIWHFSHVLAGTTIGRDCVIGQNVMIGPDVVVGNGCRIQNNVSVYKGVTLEDEVFCGPACVFTNVGNPRAGIDRKDEFVPTRVGRGATIGANATIVCGNSIGAWSFVAAGAVVTSDVPPHALVAGVPARRIGWVSHDGERLGEDLVCPRSGRRYVLRGEDRLEEVADG